MKLIPILTALATLTTFTIVKRLTRKGIRKMSVKPPKFTVGDYVRITGVTTVYRIDKYTLTNRVHTYHLEGTPDSSLYAEDVLEAIAGFEDLDDIEGEYIIPLFDVGDTVQIDGTPEVYRVIGAFPEIIYALQDLHTNEIIDMDEYVLKAFDGVIKEYDANDVDDLYNRLEAEKMAKEERKLTPREESSREAERRKQVRKERAAEIDNLLDIANWNRKQFEATGDEAFAEKEREQYAKIKTLSE